MPLRPLKTALVGSLVVGFLNVQAIGADGSVNTLVPFDGPGGSTPYSGLMRGTDGNFYGTTYRGGTNGLPAGMGTVYRLTPAGAFNTLVSFNGANGQRPIAELVQGDDGHLYGTTEYGGANNQGTFFRVTTNGVLSTLTSFNSSLGTRPAGRLLFVDGFWYGTAQLGGANGRGAVFRATPGGVATNLFSFGLTNGATPYAELIRGADGVLYGTTVTGGASGWGTLFKITTNGVLSILHSFGATNGANPYAALLFHPNGNLYGTTTYGGIGFDGAPASGFGTVFRITTNGLFSTLYSFSGGDDGFNPRSRLVVDSNGGMYGTTILGGVSGWGTVFHITTNGIFSRLTSFNYDTDGISPYGAVLPGPYGTLFGTTSSQGDGLEGTVFRLDPAGADMQISNLPGAGLLLSWSTLPGRMYQPQYRSGDQTNWNNLGLPLLAIGNSLSAADAMGTDAKRFYRVILFLPPN